MSNKYPYHIDYKACVSEVERQMKGREAPLTLAQYRQQHARRNPLLTDADWLTLARDIIDAAATDVAIGFSSGVDRTKNEVADVTKRIANNIVSQCNFFEMVEKREATSQTIDQIAQMHGALLSALQLVTDKYCVTDGTDDDLVQAARALINGARPRKPYEVSSADIIEMFPPEPPKP
jgi:hypothetical protein